MAWHDTDDFWVDFYDVMFHDRRWAAAVDEVDAVLNLTGVDPQAEVLDLFCGPGRRALELARRGFRVTGVDQTESYIEEARSLSVDDGLSSTFTVADSRTYVDADRFDLALCLYTSSGYFEDEADDVRLLRSVLSSLSGSGMFVVDVHGKEIAARAFKDRTWEELSDGAKLLEERSVGPDWAWIENKWTVIKDGGRKKPRFGLGFTPALSSRN